MNRFCWRRCLSAALILALGLPSSALALRGEAVTQSAGLEEISHTLDVRASSTDGLKDETRPAAGTEEVVQFPGWRTADAPKPLCDDFLQWMEEGAATRPMSFGAGDRYGDVRVQLHSAEGLAHSRIINVLADPTWARPFPELRKLQDQHVDSHPIPGAFGQIVVAGGALTSGDGSAKNAVFLQEVQPGDGYRRLTQRQRHALDGWRRWVVGRMIEWAEARGHLVFGPNRDLPQSRHPHEMAKNYTEVFGPDRWKPVALHTQNIGIPIRHVYAYRGNEAIQARWGRRDGFAGGLEERMPEWLQGIVPADEFPALVQRVREQTAVQTVVLFNHDILPEESPGDLAVQLIELSGTVPAALGVGDLGPWRFDTVEHKDRYPTSEYHVIRVTRHPESAPGRLGSWSAVPLIVAQAIAAGRTTFPVNLDTYAPVERVPLNNVLTQLTNLFA